MNPTPRTLTMIIKKMIITAAIIPGLAFSSLGIALPSVAHAIEACAPGTTETITLVSRDSGDATQTAGYTTTEPVAAPLLPASYEGAFSDADATDAVIPPWVDPATESDLSGAEWISSDTSNNEGADTDNQWRLFEDTFTLPAGSLIESADVWYTADNAVAVYLNGVQEDTTGDVFGPAPADPQPQHYAVVHSTGFDPVASENTLDFVVRNWAHDAENPTGLIYRAVIEYCPDPDADQTPDTSTVTIVKYIDDEMATTGTADGGSFPMSSTWTAANIGGGAPGNGTYDLSSGNSYEAVTSEMTNGASYSTQEELTGGTVGATCADNKPFALEGYKTGTSLEDAETNPLSMTAPAFTDLQEDQFVIVSNIDCSDETPNTANVTIVKYIDGEMADSASADDADFPMSSTWTAENIGAGSGTYTLSETGLNSPNPYEAVTSEMTKGATYTTSEDLTGPVVGATCAEGKPYALEGYRTADTLIGAENSEFSGTAPAFANLQDDQYVIVLNESCDVAVDPDPGQVIVTINKFVDGEQATASSSDSAVFPFTATYQADNVNGGAPATGDPYSIGPTDTVPYQTQTLPLDNGADYSTQEVLTGPVVGATCAEDKPFALQGYKVGDTFAQAMAAPMTSVVPAFTDLQQDKFVIVYNQDCTIEGGVEEDGVLAATSIDSVDTTATADGSFENGWEYLFHITTPTSEENLQMKFSNWQRTGGGGTIPVANNMRISSAQANNGGATILLTAADTYSIPALVMVTDLNPVMIGRQVEVKVEVAVPTGTPDGSYTTNYGVQTTP